MSFKNDIYWLILNISFCICIFFYQIHTSLSTTSTKQVAIHDCNDVLVFILQHRKKTFYVKV